MIIFVVAMDQNRGIGYNGKLPWLLPADMKFFRETTTGHVVFMGRKTYESIGKPLPDRTNVVLTRDVSFQAEGVQVAHSVKEAVSRYSDEDLYVIGGAEIFKEMLPAADKLLITRIHHEFPADTYFPELKDEDWEQAACTPGVTDEKNPYTFEFVELVRQARRG
jgi:dihydrofolate reductase